MSFSNSFGQWKKVFDKSAIQQVYPVFSFGNNTIICSYKGMYISSDSGNTWKLVSSSIIASKLFSKDSLLFVLTADSGLYTSFDSGKTWKAPKPWKYQYHALDAVVSGNNIIVAFVNDSMLISKDNGLTWDTTQKGLPKICHIEVL